MEKKFKKSMQKKEKSTASGGRAVAFLKGLGVAFIITCFVFVLCALVLTYTDISEKYIGLASTICTAVSAFFCGFIWSAHVKEKGLFWGMLGGLCYGVLLIAIGLLSGGGSMSLSTLTSLIIAIAGGGIGGIIGVNMK